MKTRKARYSDRENLSELHISSIKTLCGNHYSQEQIDAWTRVITPSVYDQALREKVFIVAYSSPQDLMGLGILDIQNAEISAIYIHPDVVGKGVGTALLDELEETSRKNEIARLIVHSTLNAKGFYSKRGYIAEEFAFHSLPDGSKLECIRMSKRFPLSADDQS